MTGAHRQRGTRLPALSLMAVALAVATYAIPPSAAAATRMPEGLQSWLTERVDAMDAADPYRPPEQAEMANGVSALRAVLDGSGSPEEIRELLASVGFELTEGADEVTGRSYTLLAGEPDTDRSWGAVLIDRGAPLRQAIEAPHPKSDQNTGQLGLELFRAAPGSALVIAGAHRDAGGGAADVAHRTDSMFHALAGALGERVSAEVQVHGFAADSLPGADAIVSPGAGPVAPAHPALADTLASHGFRVCAAWTQTCGELEGTTNVQGIAAAERGTPFLHLELAPILRMDASNRAVAVDSITGTWP